MAVGNEIINRAISKLGKFEATPQRKCETYRSRERTSDGRGVLAFLLHAGSAVLDHCCRTPGIGGQIGDAGDEQLAAYIRGRRTMLEERRIGNGAAEVDAGLRAHYDGP